MAAIVVLWYFDMAGRGGGRWNARIVRWSIIVVAVAFSTYRLAVFVPQPLDSPGTLRPLVYDCFTWFLGLFEEREDAFDTWYAICLAAILLPVLLAVLRYGASRGLVRLSPRVVNALGSPRLFLSSIAVCLLLCRFPALLEHEFNPDEGQFLASAQKLFYDANFFHSVDCGTSGPFNVYSLMLPAIVGISPDFASSRLIGLAAVFLSILLFYRAVALIAPEEIARIAVLPFAGAFAVFRDPEFIHYSSEHIPILITTLGFYLSVRILRSPASYRPAIFQLGMLVSTAFFTKMQSVPIVAGLAAVSLVYVYAAHKAGRLWIPPLLLLAGTVPLFLLNAALCLAAGVWTDFITTYILANTSYGAIDSPFVANLQAFVQYLTSSNEFCFFLLTVLAMGVACLVNQARQRTTSEHGLMLQLAVVGLAVASAVILPPLDRLTVFAFVGLLGICLAPVYLILLHVADRPGVDPTRWFGTLAVVSTAGALIAVYRPHHAFWHYLLLLFMPLCAWVAWMLIGQRMAFIGLVIALTVAYETYLWGYQDDHVFANVSPRLTSQAESDCIRSLAGPDKTIFVWGWTVRPYLASGRVSATRDNNVANCFRTYNLMTTPPLRTMSAAALRVEHYYIDRVLRDLRANPPAVFIDAVGPTSWFLTDPKYFEFEQFSGIADFVKTNYVFLKSDFGERLFVLRTGR